MGQGVILRMIIADLIVTAVRVHRAETDHTRDGIALSVQPPGGILRSNQSLPRLGRRLVVKQIIHVGQRQEVFPIESQRFRIVYKTDGIAGGNC